MSDQAWKTPSLLRSFLAAQASGLVLLVEAVLVTFQGVGTWAGACVAAGVARFWVTHRPSLIVLPHSTPIGPPPALLREPPPAAPDSSGAPGHMRPPGPIGAAPRPPPGSRSHRHRHSPLSAPLLPPPLPPTRPQAVSSPEVKPRPGRSLLSSGPSPSHGAPLARGHLSPGRCAPARSPAPPRHPPSPPSRTAPLGFWLSPPLHLGASLLCTCFSLAPFSALACPLPHALLRLGFCRR